MKFGETKYNYAVFMCLVEGVAFNLGYHRFGTDKWAFWGRHESLNLAKMNVNFLTINPSCYYEISDIAQIKIVEELLQYKDKNSHPKLLHERTVFIKTINSCNHNWMTEGF